MTHPVWQAYRDEPPDWVDDLGSLGAGPFLTILGLRASGVQGEALYLRCHAATGGCVAIALGIHARRRFHLMRGEVHFPSVPVCAPGVSLPSLMSALLAALDRERLRRVRIESFDAAGASLEGIGDVRRRWEYRVPVRDADAQRSALSAGHRRKVARGDRSGWRFEELYGGEAIRAMGAVKEGAASRARRRRRPLYGFGPAWDPGALVPTGEDRFGGSVWAVLDGDALLCAATVIWAGERSFYVEGGSTPAGYAAAASHWMHVRVMEALGRVGVRMYNMGGAPAGAREPENPHFGLHRFKLGFGAHVVGVEGAVINL
ncbi:MAG: peptidoglycan bridge formation glycyltransferase FemA/FemB family protein [Longimicrobiales bacterium]|nr:peptidoglycan bridge formation glycyltransferase FemA/FemB family protein [Longimicrobiales bacterium]